MSNESKHLFGPVPSRRLGYSLGLDIVPLKTCTQNCVYCQLGKDQQTTTEIKEYVNIKEVLEELEQKIADGLRADYITISGSGEPTLNSGLGELIEGIKKITQIPVAVITNGTLLWNEQVRRNISKADVVLPSLDAGSEEVFDKINRPDENITFQKLVDGLIEFRKQFSNEIWLEVFFIEGYNTSAVEITKMSRIIELINPDKVQLNTAVRPTSVKGVKMVEPGKLAQIAEQLSDKSEIIADFSKVSQKMEIKDIEQAVFETLKRRPCSIDGLARSLGLNINEVIKHITHLLNSDKILGEERDGETYYLAK